MEQSIALLPIEEADEQAQLERISDIRSLILGLDDIGELHKAHSNLIALESTVKRHTDIASSMKSSLKELAFLRLETEREIGGRLLKLPREQGRRSDRTLSDGPTKSDETFSEAIERLGISRDSAYAWQWVAQYPQDKFDSYINRHRDLGLWGIPTQSRIVEMAKAHEQTKVENEDNRQIRHLQVKEAKASLDRDVDIEAVLNHVTSVHGLIDGRTRKTIQEYFEETRPDDAKASEAEAEQATESKERNEYLLDILHLLHFGDEFEITEQNPKDFALEIIEAMKSDILKPEEIEDPITKIWDVLNWLNKFLQELEVQRPDRVTTTQRR